MMVRTRKSPAREVRGAGASFFFFAGQIFCFAGHGPSVNINRKLKRSERFESFRKLGKSCQGGCAYKCIDTMTLSVLLEMWQF